MYFAFSTYILQDEHKSYEQMSNRKSEVLDTSMILTFSFS